MELIYADTQKSADKNKTRLTTKYRIMVVQLVKIVTPEFQQ